MKKNINFVLSLIIAVLIQACSSSKNNNEVSQWRGPNRDGIYPEKNLLKEWPEEGPELLWKYEGLGVGYTSAAVTSKQVFTTGTIDSLSYLFAFDHTGKLLWKREFGKEWMESFPGARTTPLIVGNLGYVVSGMGYLLCFHTENGNTLWSKNIFVEYDGKNPRFGLTENLLADGNKLFCTPGGVEANVIALNRMTGDLIWKSKGSGEISAFCSPSLINMNGNKFYTIMTDQTLISIDIETGKLAWKYDLIKRIPGTHANSPIFHDGCLFVMDRHDSDCFKLKLTEGGYAYEVIWKNEYLDYTSGNSVLVDGYLFGSSGTKNKWYCIDWLTGEKIYSSSLLKPGSIISADNMLYCYAETGELALVKPSTKKIEITSSIKIPGNKNDHWAHPVIHNGRLYVRYHNDLWVYNIAAS